MTGQQRWEVKRSGATKTATVSAKDLAIYIQQGAVGPSHRFRLEGSTEWLSLDQAQLLLPEPEIPTTSQSHSSKAAQSKAQSTPAQSSLQTPSKGSDTRRPARDQQATPPVRRKPAAAKRPAASTRKSPSSSPAAKQPSPSKRAAKTRQPVAPPVKQVPKERWNETPEENPGMALPTLAPERQQRRPAAVGFDEDDVDMTSMIDMTFLLLVFFMVTSTISPYANLQLPEARAGDAERPEGRVVMILDYPQAADGSADPAENSDDRFTGSDFIALKDCRLYLEGEEGTPIPPDALQPALQQAFEENGGGEFILQSNRKMPVGVVREVLKLAKSAGAGETMIGVARPR